MNSIRLAAVISALSVTVSALPAAAEDAAFAGARRIHPVQVSLWPSVQTNDPNHTVHGMRLNLPYGKSRHVRGFDLGIANHTTGTLYGAEFGFGGYVGGDMRGVQNHLILSITRGQAWGFQQGIYTSAGGLAGVQAGFVNVVHNDALGARFGAVNLSYGSSEGAELALVNYARKVRGLQLGLVNVTGELHGVQIGLVNFAKNGFLPFVPVLNAAM